MEVNIGRGLVKRLELELAGEVLNCIHNEAPKSDVKKAFRDYSENFLRVSKGDENLEKQVHDSYYKYMNYKTRRGNLYSEELAKKIADFYLNHDVTRIEVAKEFGLKRTQSDYLLKKIGAKKYRKN